MRPARIVLVIAALSGLGGAVWWRWGRAAAPPAWRTTTVSREDVRQVVSATGTLEAVQTVEVGAQVSGLVAELGADFNAQVKAGQVLARIDPALAQADVASATARLAEARATADRLQLERDRVGRMFDKQAATEQERVAAEADLAVAKAQVQSAQVSLDRARRNLGYTTITAPIDGTVIRRDVEVGQTVNAGLSAPTLFLIAGDLARMRILVAVDESDIGLIREGQAATFTVQTYPDRTFEGKVQQVRLQSAVAESVVTYTVVVDVDNTDRALLPGMTATVEFTVAEAPDALCVASAALRYQPDEAVTVIDSGGGGARPPATPPGSRGAPPSGSGPSGARGEGRGGRASKQGTVYVAEGAGLRAVPVTLGLRGATCTEVSGEGVTEGLTVVTGVDRAAAEGGGGGAPASPFGPKSGGGGPHRPGGF